MTPEQREFANGLRATFRRWKQSWSEYGPKAGEPESFRFTIWRLMDGAMCEFKVTRGHNLWSIELDACVSLNAVGVAEKSAESVDADALRERRFRLGEAEILYSPGEVMYVARRIAAYARTTA